MNMTNAERNRLLVRMWSTKKFSFVECQYYTTYRYFGYSSVESWEVTR